MTARQRGSGGVRFNLSGCTVSWAAATNELTDELLRSARHNLFRRTAVFLDVLGDIQQQIYEQRPEIFVGGSLGPPHLYIKGEAGEFVRDLVAAAPLAILIIDRQPYSFDGNDRRVAQFAGELQRLGFDDFGVGADITRESLIEATVKRVPGAPDGRSDHGKPAERVAEGRGGNAV